MSANLGVAARPLDHLSDVLDGWGVKNKPSELDVERALDRHAVWIGRGVAVRRVKDARKIDGPLKNRGHGQTPKVDTRSST